MNREHNKLDLDGLRGILAEVRAQTGLQLKSGVIFNTLNTPVNSVVVRTSPSRGTSAPPSNNPKQKPIKQLLTQQAEQMSLLTKNFRQSNTSARASESGKMKIKE